MEADACEARKGDPMCVGDLDRCGVEIGRGCKYTGVIAAPNAQTVEQEVGGSSPPNCTTTVELPRTLSILLISQVDLRLQKYKRRYKWLCGWLP